MPSHNSPTSATSPTSAARTSQRQRAAQRRRPRVSRLLAWLLAAWLGSGTLAQAQGAPGALPTGGQVVVGSAQLLQANNLLVVQQNSNRLGLDWQAFNIGSGATVEFRQPNAGSVALNRVLGNSASQIYGQLKANGQVFLTNPNGVLFAPGAKVDVGGLVASTLDLSQQDFADGRYHFAAANKTDSSASVVNQGSLRASAGGYLVLLGQQVHNQGDITVDAGSVMLASGRAATVSISGSGLLSAVVTPATLQGRVDNSGRIVADGGVVTLTAKSAQDIAASLVNNSGIVRANTLVERAGEIWISGDNVVNSGTLSAAAPAAGDAGRIALIGDMQRGTAQVAGTLDASAAAGSGGFIETSAAHVKVAGDTRVSTAASKAAGTAAGTWLIDPVDFTIAASGGDITGATLAASLSGGNVTIQSSSGSIGTAGNVNVNDTVAWSANRLTLNAQNNVNINAALTGSGTASLALEVGQGAVAANNVSSFNVAAAVSLPAGNNFITKLGSDGTPLTYTVITNLAGLQALDGNTATLAGNYALGANITADASANGGLGFNPIGSETAYGGSAGQYFNGRFDGLGHSISGLAIARPTSNYVGLFAVTRGAIVRNLTLAGGAVAGRSYAGALVGYADTTTLISNVSASVAVSSIDNNGSGAYAGGLVGRFEGSATGANGILNSSSSGAVLARTNTGVAFAGGVVGYVTRGTLSGLNAGGAVSTESTVNNFSSHFAGGVVGINHSPAGLTGAVASGSVASLGVAGGLVGAFDGGGDITSSRATGAVSGGAAVGGLAGRSAGDVTGVVGVVTASGNVTGTGNVGGLVGESATAGVFSNVSASGTVTGAAAAGRVGGLIGSNASGGVSGGSATGAVSGGQYTGGLVGYFVNSGSISHSSADGAVSGSQDVGGLVGYASGAGSLSNGLAKGLVTGVVSNGSVGGLVGYFNLSGGLSVGEARGNVSGGDNSGGLVGNYAATAALVGGVASGGTLVGGANYAGGLVGYSNASAISGSTATASVAGGTYAGGLVGRSGGSVTGVAGTTTASGNVSGTTHVGGLVGSAEGTGSFTDVKATGSVTASATGARTGGLIGNAASGGINRATATGSVSGGQYVGGLVGLFSTAGNISNASASGNVAGTQDVGGLVGYASGGGAMTDSQATGTVTGTVNSGSVGGLVGYFALAGGLARGTASGNVPNGANVGGLVGYYNTSATLSDSASTATQVGGTTAGYVGGLVGYSNAALISGSTATANIGSGQYAGGLVGRTAGSVTGVAGTTTATGNVSGSSYVGGLVGSAEGSGSFTDVSASGNVQGSNAGGLVGYYTATGAITRGVASGNVSTTNTGGGLVGYHNGGVVADSRASGSVTAVSEGYVYLGGLVGQFGANCYFCSNTGYAISNSSATGSVRADSYGGYLGGLVGLVYSGNISGSTSGNNGLATVTAVDSVNGNVSSFYNGGLVGYFGYYNTTGSITSNSNSSASVSGGGYVGGLAGHYRGAELSNSSARGAVSGGAYVGGLAGNAEAYGPISNVSASGAVSGGAGAYAGGLFGQLTLQSGGLSNGFASGAVSAAGGSYVGGLVGYLSGASTVAAAVNDSAATGNVSGGNYSAGLVGYYYNYYGQSPLLNSRASGSVAGTSYAGGLVGGYYRYATTGSADDISNSFATGAVSGSNYVGGLVGDFEGRRGIAGSYATGNVVGTGSTSQLNLGGLVGYYYAYHTSTSATAPLRGSYASGNVGLAAGATLATSTSVYAGGLVGWLDGALTATAIADAYATGSVVLANTRGRLYAGGLVGFDSAQNVQRAYATGAVSATGGNTRAAGGLLAGRSSGSVTDSYWNTTSTGQAASLGGGTGVASAALLQAATYSSWDIANSGSAGKTWRIYEGATAPLLSNLLTPLTLALADASKTYDGSKALGNFVANRPSSEIAFDRIFAGAAAADVGSYSVAAAGVYSVQNGYDLTVTGSATLSITPKAITLAGVVADKVYDGTRAATLLATAQPAGLVAGESLTVNMGGASAVFDTRNAGSGKAVSISGLTLADGTGNSGGKASNYVLVSSTASSASITPAALNVGGFSATARAYDGSTTVAVTAAGGTVTGKIGSDDVVVDVAAVTSGSIASKNVGSAKPVTVLGATLAGADAGNYRIAGTDTLTVDITPRALTVNGLTASNREYDRSLNVSVSTNTATLGGAVAGDAVQLQRTSVNGLLADKNAQDGKTVTVAGSSMKLRGADAANYSLQSTTTTADIAKRTVYFYVNRVTASDKVYDGSTAAVASPYVSNAFSNDNAVLSFDAPTFADKAVAYTAGGVVTSKTITVGGAKLTGTDAANYSFNNTSNTTSGTITPRPLTVSGVSATDRAYDGTRNVAVNVSGATVDTSVVVAGDVVTVTLPGAGTVVGTVLAKDAGNAKAVTVPGFSLGGVDSGNYSLSGNSGVTVNIGKKNLTAVYTGIDKVYDGNAFAGLSVASADIVAGDSLGFYADQSYCSTCGYAYFATPTSTPTNYTQSKDAGVGKTVVVTTNQMYGNDVGNYTLLNPRATITASITPKGITPVFNGVAKVYDGSTTATVTLNTNASGIISSDGVSLARTATFDTKNVGTGKAVSITDIAFTGTSAGNYTLAATTASTTAAITPKALSVQGVAATDRAYDGSTTVALSAAGTVGAGGVVGSDVVSVNVPGTGLGNGTVANKNVGTAKAVTVSGLSLAGTDAANYTLNGSLGVTVNVSPKALTASFAGVDRVYNGGVTAQVAASSADLVTGDVLTYTQNAVFTGLDARNVGSNKPIAISGVAIAGTDAANYTLQNTTASATGGVTPKGINVTYTGLTRVYDGVADTNASVQGNSSGLVAGDIVSFTQTARFATDGAAGDGKLVNISSIALAGAQGGNYSLLQTTASTTANISKRALGITGITATNRVYDGTRNVAVNTVGAAADASTIISGDQVAVVLPSGGITTGTVATKDAGANKDVTVTGLTLTGSSAANYAVGGANGLTVSITPRALTASYGAATKVYDGNATAQVSATSADLLAADVGALGITASGVFSAGKDAGLAKTVAVSGGFLTGVERNNYTLQNASASSSADITRKTLNAGYQGGTRVYDGSTAAPVSAASTGVVTGDVVAFAQTAVFTGAGAKNVGSGKAVAVSDIALSGADAGNYQLAATTASASASVTPKPIAIDGLTSATATDRVYDGTRTVAVTITTSGTITPSSTDIVAGDVVQINLPAGGVTTGTLASKGAARNKPLVVDGLTLAGADAGNYLVAATNGVTVNITPKPLNAVYAGVNKVYNGATDATVTGASADILGADSVGIAGGGVFTGAGAKNVGLGKALNVISGTLIGTDAANYALVNTTGTASANITPKAITAAYGSASKVYDGSTAAAVTSTTSGFISGDAVLLAQTAVFSGGKNAGNNKAVQVSAIMLSGGDAANYTLTANTATTNGNITPKPLRIDGLTGVAAQDRAYDGSSVVSVVVSASGPIAPNPADLVAGDVVTVTAPSTGTTTGTLLDKNAGPAKPVAVAGLALGGADANNYSITATSGVTVNITPKAVTAVYSAGSRVYDGTVNTGITGTSADFIANDFISLTGSGVFTGSGAKNAGTGKAVDVRSTSLAGADASNYSLRNPTGSATGNITPKLLTVAYEGGTRVYDGSANAPVAAANTSGVLTGDVVGITQQALFTGSGAKNVGTAKAVAVSGITLAGDDAGNYTLNSTTATTTASVTPKPLRIDGFSGVVATDRIYDGSTAVAITVLSTGPIAPNAADVVAGDTVSVVPPPAGPAAGILADKNVGLAKPVAVAGVTLAGADAGNYMPSAAIGLTVNITPKPLTAAYTGISKVYDGTAVATLAGSSADIVSGDLVTIKSSGAFTGSGAKNAGTGKTISVSGGTLGSADAANYTLLNSSGSASADITPRPLVASYTGGSRVYDGGVAAPVTASSTGVVAGDLLSFGQSAVFSGAGARNAGSGKTVEVSGITLAGADAANYMLTATTASTTASITPRPLNVSGLSGLAAVDRVYDGTRDVQITGSLAVGNLAGDIIAGDNVTVGLAGGALNAGTMVDKAAGSAKSVAVSGLTLGGADAANYQITGTAGVTVNIAQRPVVLLGLTTVDRIYDASTLVAVNSSSGSLTGALPGDDLQLRNSGVTGSMADKHAGSAKAVVVTGLSLAGADAGNYTAAGGSNLTVNITPRTLVATASAADKVYDGRADAIDTLADNRVAGDTLTVTRSSARFASKDAGAAQAVTVSGLALAGADAGDYVLASTSAATSATIKPAPLAVNAGNLSKVYGETVNLSGAAFSTVGLVAGETLAAVTLTSAGAAATAVVTSSPYAIVIANASGGSFNPANYVLSYGNGALAVTPRPLTVAGNNVVRYADQPNPASFGFSTNGGGLVNGDSVTAVLLPAPTGSATAAGGSVFELVPSGAVFAGSQAGNYTLRYSNGLLLVLPTPPRVGDTSSAAGGAGGGQGLAVLVDQAELTRALAALERSNSALAQPAVPGSPTAAQARTAQEATAAELGVLLAGDGGRITLAALLRLPLVSYDPGLRRLIFGTSAPTP